MEPAGWAAAIFALGTALILILRRIGAAKDEKAIKRDKLAEVEAKETDDAMADTDARIAAERVRRNGTRP